MVRSGYRHWLLFVFALVSIASVAMHAQAQLTSDQELPIKLPAGSLFEIIVEHSIDKPVYSWVLNRDRTFIQAGRTRVFRFRLTQDGRYQLAGEVTAESGEQTRRIIPITVEPRRPSDLPTLITDGRAALVKTSPSADADGDILLTHNKRIIQLIPTRQDFRSLTVDLDLERDTDFNGQKDDDNDVEGAYFTTQGTPLHIWFAYPLTERTLTINAVLENGETVRQQLTVLTQKDIVGRDVPRMGEGDIIARTQEDGSIAFSVNPTSIRTITAPLLYQWDFGDGQQSLLDKPLHMYPDRGRYSVVVRIRNIETGKKLRTFKTDIVIEAAAPVTPEQPSEEEPTKRRSMLGLIFKIIFALLISGALGFGAVFVFSKFKGKVSLTGALEKAEEKLVGKEGVPAEVTEAPPMAIPEVEEEEQPVMEAELAEEEEPTEPLVIEKEEAPEWLAKGLEKAEEKGIKPETPTPPTLEGMPPPTEVPEAPLPAEEAVPPVPPTEEAAAPLPEAPPTEQPPPAEAGPAPDWLAQAEGATPPPPPAETAPPVEPTPPPPPPAAAPAEAPPTAPEISPASTAPPVSEEGQLPPWLQPDAAGAPPVEKVPTKPTPTELVLNVSLSTDKSDYKTDVDRTAVLQILLTDENGNPVTGLDTSAFATTLDGSPTSIAFTETATPGTFAANLPLSGVPEGTHALAVTVTDTRGLTESGSASFSISAPTTEDTEKLEREREKKRRKRQRYRENLRLRREEGQAKAGEQAPPEAPPAEPPSPAEMEMEEIKREPEAPEPIAFIRAEDISEEKKEEHHDDEETDEGTKMAA